MYIYIYTFFVYFSIYLFFQTLMSKSQGTALGKQGVWPCPGPRAAAHALPDWQTGSNSRGLVCSEAAVWSNSRGPVERASGLGQKLKVPRWANKESGLHARPPLVKLRRPRCASRGVRMAKPQEALLGKQGVWPCPARIPKPEP